MTQEAIYRVGLNQEQNVLVDLGVVTQYVILTPERALELAAWLIKHAQASSKAVRRS